MPSKPRRVKERASAPTVAPGRGARQHPAGHLRTIPGVGPSIQRDLEELGIRRVADLVGRDPERLYRRLIALRGAHQDRCLLYVFRCAVYFAETARPRADLLRWWNWKDRA